MSDSNLRSRLAALRPPPTTDAAHDRALHRATLARASAAFAGEPSVHPMAARRLVPFILGAVASLVLVFGLGRLLQHAPANESRPRPLAGANASDPVAESLRLLAQVQQLFPHRLNAVIDRDGALQLDLLPVDAALAADQPILVQFTHAGHTIRVLGFSGRAVELRIDNRLVRFAPLLTGQGSVLLAGDDFAWSPGFPSPDVLAGWEINTRPLPGPVL